LDSEHPDFDVEGSLQASKSGVLYESTTFPDFTQNPQTMNINAFNPQPTDLHHGVMEQLGYSIQLFQLDEKINLLHQWVNLPYARRFWQMQGTLKDLYLFYYEVLTTGSSLPFWLFHKNEPLTFFEMYEVRKSPLDGKYDTLAGDYGFHILMAPPRDLLKAASGIPQISVLILKAIIQFAFGFTCIQRLVCEPDIQNINANRLAVQAGFTFHKQVEVDQKLANLYIYPSSDFH